MNALGLKIFIESLSDETVPVMVTFGEYQYRVISALDQDGKLTLVALAEGDQLKYQR